MYRRELSTIYLILKLLLTVTSIKALVHDFDETLGWRGQEFALAGDDAIAAFRKILVYWNNAHSGAVFFSEANVGDNGNSLAKADVSFDYFPATGFKRDAKINVVLGKHHFHDMPGA